MIELDLTPNGLFPQIPNAAADAKCQIISKVFNEIAQNRGIEATQDAINNNAKTRYEFLSQEGKLKLPDADHRAFLLYQMGVTHGTAKEYISFRLTDADARSWSIVITPVL